jgi:hypothetical protein
MSGHTITQSDLDRIPELHRIYCQLTHIPLPYTASHWWPWESFLNRFTEDDLRLVVKFMNNLKSRGKPVRQFTFRSFISGPNSLDYFAEDLAESRAWARQSQQEPGVPARVRVLSATGRTQAVVDTSRSAEAVMRGNVELRKLLELRDQL